VLRESCAFYWPSIRDDRTERYSHDWSFGFGGDIRKKVQTGVADDSKRLKNAETLIRRTSFRLKDILHEVSYEDQPALEATVRRLNEIQTRLMMQVFRK